MQKEYYRGKHFVVEGASPRDATPPLTELPPQPFPLHRFSYFLCLPGDVGQ